MKRSKTIFALLLALTLLLRLTTVAFAGNPTITVNDAPAHTTKSDVVVDSGDSSTATFTWEAKDDYYMADPKVEITLGTGAPVENGEQATYAADTKTVTLTNLESDAAYKVILSTDFYTPINYDDGVSDGSVSNKLIDVMNLKEGDTLTITDTIPERTNFVFTGWKSDYDEKVYQAGETLTVPGVDEVKMVNLIAQWAPALTIEYKTDASDSVSGMPDSTSNPVTVGAGNQFTTAAAPSRSGFIFQGWRASWDKELYKAKAAVKAPDKPNSGTVLTLTAEWKKMSAIPGNPVGGGGSGGGSSSQSYYYIYADCSSGGSVSPSGYTRVSADGSLTVSFAPKSGYSILAVHVTG